MRPLCCPARPCHDMLREQGMPWGHGPEKVLDKIQRGFIILRQCATHMGAEGPMTGYAQRWDCNQRWSSQAKFLVVTASHQRQQFWCESTGLACAWRFMKSFRMACALLFFSMYARKSHASNLCTAQQPNA